MARINTYAIDDNVTSQDKWIGTDVAGNVTKNFTPENVANWINKTNAVGVAGQSNFKFQVDLSPERLSGTISFELGSGDGTAFSAINNIIISKYGGDGNLILDYLENLVGTYILLCQVDDTNNFGVYQLGSLTQLEDEPNFYNAVLSVQSSNGTLTANEYYGVVAYPASSIVSVTGLEAIDEGNGDGWRLIGRDPDNYGDIGKDAIDFSNSTEATNENGSVGDRAITFGTNNINESGRSIITGSGVNLRKTNDFSANNIVTGESPLNIWGVTYNSLIAAWRSEVNVEGASYDTNVVYQSLIVGDGLNFYSGRDSGVVGGGLISGSTGCFTVGVGNEDLTTTTSSYITSQYNNYGPRFIVGCGTYNPVTQVATRANGFVVMSDGTATFPILTNAKIDTAGDDSAVTKGWVNTNTGNISGSGTANYIPKWSDADTIADSVIYDNGTNVGIGTTNPAAPLSISNLSSNTLELNSSISSQSRILSYNRSSFTYRDLVLDGLDIIFKRQSSETMRITSSGNVGIGTTSPAEKLHVFNAGFPQMRLESNAGSWEVGVSTSNDFVFRKGTSGTDYPLVLDSTSNVGIGTTSPTGVLDVLSTDDQRYARFRAPNGEERFEFYIGSTGNSSRLSMFQSDGTTEGVKISSEGVSFFNGGNVGIGTTSPAAKLEISETGTTGAALYVDTARYGIVVIGDGTSNSQYLLNLQGNGGSTNAMVVQSSGNVGIGTTSPSLSLDIDSGAANSALRVLSTDRYTGIKFEDSLNNDTLFYDGQDGLMYLSSTNFRAVDIYATGKVGIGTTSPSEKLDIDGNVKLGATTGRQLMFGENKYGAVRLGNNLVIGGNQAVDIRTGNAAISSQSSRVFINQTGFVGIGTTSPIALLDVNGPIKIGDATTSPLANTVGTMRYRADSNNSYLEMVMQTGASTYAWVVIQQNTW